MQGSQAGARAAFRLRLYRAKGSHEQYEKIVDGRKYKVTVDCHGGEVKAMDVRPIISQAGLTKSEFYAAFKK